MALKQFQKQLFVVAYSWLHCAYTELWKMLFTQFAKDVYGENPIF